MKNRKISIIMTIFILSLLVVSCGDSKKEHIEVTISIYGLEDNEAILEPTTLDVEEGATAIDVLKDVTRENKIHLDYTGSKGSVYIKGIANLYEFDEGPESGWIYRVNDEIVSTSAGSYKLENGDVIEWLYTLELGKEFER